MPAFLPALLPRFAADIYGPSEQLIGRYLASHPAEKLHVQVSAGCCSQFFQLLARLLATPPDRAVRRRCTAAEMERSQPTSLTAQLCRPPRPHQVELLTNALHRSP